ncbi:MAG: adenylate/guanylate cyclase domain-containing protein [Saprospiraceae bacterium]
MRIPEKPTVLYIDDEPDNLVVFKSAFRRDYNVLTTTSPDEALEMLKGEEIPVVITDQRMPSCTGVELLEQIPTDLSNVRIILTGFSDVEVIIQAINKCGIYRYITKPWDREELKHTINLAFEKYYLKKNNLHLLDELKEANEALEEKVKLRTQELQIEKERANQLLLNILPEETAHELMRRGKVSPKVHSDVTILFIDIAGFTKLTEKMEPEDLIEELDYYYKVFDTIFSKHGVEKIKTIGDAYLAVAGINSQEENSAVCMIKAVQELMSFIEQEKSHRSRIGRPHFEVRVGIHSGTVITGVVGHTKFAFDIWGDDVNLASRCESSGVTGQINVSESTYDLAKSHFEFEPRGEIEAKNKGKVNMYFVK